MNPRFHALDFLTSCLSLQKSPESNALLRQNISAGYPNWHKVIALANANLVTPTLWVALRDRGLATSLPDHVRQYLFKLHALNSRRNRRLREQAAEAVRHINAIGVTPILLKGAASLFVPTYDDPGSRTMIDLDLLVPPRDADRCWGRLHTEGYVPIEDNFDYSRHNHLRPLSRDGYYGTIEIHRHALRILRTGRVLGASLMSDEVAHITNLILQNAVPISGPNVTIAVPAPTERTLHCLLHSSMADKNAYRCGTLPLRSLHELALLQTQLDGQIDWEGIRQLLGRGRKLPVLNAWLYLAHKLFGTQLPPDVPPTIGAVLHYLRTKMQARWALSITLTTISRA